MSKQKLIEVRTDQTSNSREAELLHQLMELTQYTLGNRESREGNPYCRPSVQAALKTIAKYRGKDDFLNALDD